MPKDAVPRQVTGDQADLHRQAVEHVDRALREYPSLSGVDRECFVGIVEQHLQPLDPNRPLTRRRRATPRSVPVWVGGLIGLHLPQPREVA